MDGKLEGKSAQLKEERSVVNELKAKVGILEHEIGRKQKLVDQLQNDSAAHGLDVTEFE